MASLILYPTSTTDSLLLTADTIVAVDPASSGSGSTSVGKNLTGWIELPPQGGGTVTPAGTEPSPSGKGWLYDVTTLENQQFDAGTWTAAVGVGEFSGNGVVADVHVRYYKRSSAGVYTQIADTLTTGVSLGSTFTVLTITGTTGSATSFSTGDKFYVDVVLNITTGDSNHAGGTLGVEDNSGTRFKITTPNVSSGSPQGTANLSQTQTLSATGHVTVSGSASLSQTQTLTPAGHALISGGASLSQSVTLTTVGAAGFLGSASLSQSATLTATGQTVVSGSATLSQTQTLTTVGVTKVSGSASLQQTQTLTASGGAGATGSASLAQSATLTATSATTVFGSASLTQSTTLTAQGAVVVLGSASLQIAQSLAATGTVVATTGGVAGFSQSTNLVATATVIGPTDHPGTLHICDDVDGRLIVKDGQSSRLSTNQTSASELTVKNGHAPRLTPKTGPSSRIGC